MKFARLDQVRMVSFGGPGEWRALAKFAQLDPVRIVIFGEVRTVGTFPRVSFGEFAVGPNDGLW